MKRKFTKEEFIQAVRSCCTIADVLRSLNLSPRGGNYQTVNRFVKEYKLDTSHWLGHAHLKGKKRSIRKIPTEQLLVPNSSFSRAALKKRLLEEGLLEKKCSVCDQGNEWNNEPLVLILDHINGIGNDNRLENLRIVCPNCNSQLPTFCGRKNKRKSQQKKGNCISCGNEICHKAKMCRRCAQIKQRKVERPSYRKLKRDREKMSLKSIGKKYGVSDNTIRKWINLYEDQRIKHA